MSGRIQALQKVGHTGTHCYDTLNICNVLLLPAWLLWSPDVCFTVQMLQDLLYEQPTGPGSQSESHLFNMADRAFECVPTAIPYG